ncbi:hypothetical protein ACQKL5_09695 [Peribacillus sp. NPDC097675]|uniref:hypothetical protein n=1 Tax=Peribacillus sp. NPDC097675 TaxID=3390618 RepID=UPI003D034EAD
MEANQKVMDALKWVSGTGCTIGILLVLFSFFVSGYNKGYILTTIGITIALSAASIFLIGILFVLTEEMTQNTKKGQRIVPESSKLIKFKAKAKRRKVSI